MIANNFYLTILFNLPTVSARSISGYSIKARDDTRYRRLPPLQNITKSFQREAGPPVTSHSYNFEGQSVQKFGMYVGKLSLRETRVCEWG